MPAPELFRTLTKDQWKQRLEMKDRNWEGFSTMDISRWHRNTSLLSMSLSIDSAFRKQDRDADVALVLARRNRHGLVKLPRQIVTAAMVNDDRMPLDVETELR